MRPHSLPSGGDSSGGGGGGEGTNDDSLIWSWRWDQTLTMPEPAASPRTEAAGSKTAENELDGPEETWDITDGLNDDCLTDALVVVVNNMVGETPLRPSEASVAPHIKEAPECHEQSDGKVPLDCDAIDAESTRSPAASCTPMHARENWAICGHEGESGRTLCDPGNTDVSDVGPSGTGKEDITAVGEQGIGQSVATSAAPDTVLKRKISFWIPRMGRKTHSKTSVTSLGKLGSDVSSNSGSDTSSDSDEMLTEREGTTLGTFSNSSEKLARVSEASVGSVHAPCSLPDAAPLDSASNKRTSFWSLGRERKRHNETASKSFSKSRNDVGTTNGGDADSNSQACDNDVEDANFGPQHERPKPSSADDICGNQGRRDPSSSCTPSNILLIEIWEIKVPVIPELSPAVAPEMRGLERAVDFAQSQNPREGKIFNPLPIEVTPADTNLPGDETAASSVPTLGVGDFQLNPPDLLATTGDREADLVAPIGTSATNRGSSVFPRAQAVQDIDDNDDASVVSEASTVSILSGVSPTETPRRRGLSTFSSPFKGSRSTKSQLAREPHALGRQALTPEVLVLASSTSCAVIDAATGDREDLRRAPRSAEVVRPRPADAKTAVQNAVLWGRLSIPAAEVLGQANTDICVDQGQHARNGGIGSFTMNPLRRARSVIDGILKRTSVFGTAMDRRDLEKTEKVDDRHEEDLGVEALPNSSNRPAVDGWFEVEYPGKKQGKAKRRIHLALRCVGNMASGKP